MGVSLKKTGASGSVKIMNNDTPEKRRRELGYNFKKDISLNSLVYDNKIKYSGDNAFKQWPMDVYIQYGTAEKEHIQLRNFGGKDTGDWKLEIKGVYANMGKVQGNVARFILNQTGFTNIPQEADFKKCNPKDSTKTLSILLIVITLKVLIQYLLFLNFRFHYYNLDEKLLENTLKVFTS